MQEITDANIEKNYEKFYSERRAVKVYPTEFVVRIFLAQYPNLFFKKPKKGNSILDVGFGDGRNTAFLCDLGLNVFGVEITQTIVDLTSERLKTMGYSPELCVGRNSTIPYNDNFFDYILACHSCYYCDQNETFLDNMREYSRVLRPGGRLIASVPDVNSYIFNGAHKLSDGTYEITRDPYNNRIGYRLHPFASVDEIRHCFGAYFTNISVAYAHNNYFGIDEKVFWIVCENFGKW